MYDKNLTIGRTGYFVAFIQVPCTSMAAEVNAGFVVGDGARGHVRLVQFIFDPSILGNVPLKEQRG